MSAIINLKPNDLPTPAIGVYYWEPADKSEAILVKSLEESRLLNSSGRLIWNLCDGKRTINELLDLLVAHYPEQEKTTLAKHLNDFLDDLHSQGYLIFDGVVAL